MKETGKVVIYLAILLGKMLITCWGMMWLWNRLAYGFNAPTYGYGMFILAYLLYKFGASKIKSFDEFSKVIDKGA